MGWSMGSIDCLAIKINKDYIEALKKDVEEYEKNPNITAEMSEENKAKFEWLLTNLEANDLEDEDTFYEHYADYLSSYGPDNYAQSVKVNYETGECEGRIKDFDGYVLEVHWGAKSIYEPEFTSKEKLKESIEESFYIPRTFKWKDNLIFLTGIWER